MTIASDETLREVRDALTDPTLPTDAATETTLAAMSAKLPASLGAKAPTASASVTGSLATSFTTPVADTMSTGSAAQLSSLAAGPSGIRVQNTTASGGANIRVGGSNAVSATRGVQIAPGISEIFSVTNADKLWVIYESNSPAAPTYSVSEV